MVLQQWMPLMVDATYGSLDMLRLIVAAGPAVDVNWSCFPDGSTTLHCAGRPDAARRRRGRHCLRFRRPPPSQRRRLAAQATKPEACSVQAPRRFRRCARLLMGDLGFYGFQVGVAVQADSRSLATLSVIRDIQAKRLPYREFTVQHVHRGSFSQGSWIGEMQQASDKSVIISEILDPRTKNLLSMSKISDYVLSNELVSMALAMVAEDRQINDVLELFGEEGNEVHIRPADLLFQEEEELSF